VGVGYTEDCLNLPEIKALVLGNRETPRPVDEYAAHLIGCRTCDLLTLNSQQFFGRLQPVSDSQELLEMMRLQQQDVTWYNGIYRRAEAMLGRFTDYQNGRPQEQMQRQ
jgi:hypothetical protein|tara:strand:- start:208 stop:534 length:327 start_codon:yes stop_codon:yes gene_type:complete